MIDFSQFKKFKIANILKIYNGKGITKEEIEDNPGDFNAIQSGESNNGIIGKIDKDYCISKNYIYTENPCLTVARTGSSGYVAFQPNGCVVGDSAKILELKNGSKSENLYLFLKVLLSALRIKYAYGRKVTEDNYGQEIIMLPVKHNSDGSVYIDKDKTYSEFGYVPDWLFMENYIEKLMLNIPKTKNICNSSKINTQEWQYFKLKEVFSFFESGKISSTAVLEDGDEICYIGAKKTENGVIQKCLYNEQFVSKGNCIMFICDGQGSIGYNNYIDRDFIGTVNLELGYSENLNKYNALFLVTVLDTERPKFSFGRKRKATLPDTQIKLPAIQKVDGTYEPNWQYMEDYIKSLPYADLI